MLPLPPDKRAKGRRIAEAVLGAPARVRARRTGDGTTSGSAEPPRQVSAEEAAKRLDAARERLRARIAAPDADDGEP